MSHCHSASSVVNQSSGVNFSYFQLLLQTVGMILMRLGRDEVLMVMSHVGRSAVIFGPIPKSHFDAFRRLFGLSRFDIF